jgi:hypothetical protein
LFSLPAAALSRLPAEPNVPALAGVPPAGGSPEAFQDRIRKEVPLWRKAVADSGVKVQ